MYSRIGLSFLLIIPIFLFLWTSTAFGETDPKVEEVLGKMDAARHPEGLEGFWCNALILTTIDGERVTDIGLTPPGVPIGPHEIHIYYVGPSDYNFWFGGFAAEYTYPAKGLRYRGDDPMMLANPALKQVLTTSYSIGFTGTQLHDGDECYVLRLVPNEEAREMVPFELYIKESDGLPVHTSIVIQTEGGEVRFDTEIGYTQFEGFMLPSTITTIAKPHDGPVFTTTTSFSKYTINPLTKTIHTSDSNTEATEADEVDEGAFEDIHHGFEDPPLEVKLGGESALYSRLRFAFALEVPSKSVSKELNKRHSGIVDAVCDVLSGRHWKDLEGRRYEVGRELMEVINGILSEGDVTDFYFTIYEARR